MVLIFGILLVLVGVAQLLLRKAWARRAAALADSAKIPFFAHRSNEFWARASIPFIWVFILAGGVFVLVGSIR